MSKAPNEDHELMTVINNGINILDDPCLPYRNGGLPIQIVMKVLKNIKVAAEPVEEQIAALNRDIDGFEQQNLDLIEDIKKLEAEIERLKSANEHWHQRVSHFITDEKASQQRIDELEEEVQQLESQLMLVTDQCKELEDENKSLDEMKSLLYDSISRRELKIEELEAEVERLKEHHADVVRDMVEDERRNR